MSKTPAMTLLILLAPCLAIAEPPKTLHVVQTVAIKAPLDKVWAAARDFDGLAKWHPALDKDEIVKGANNTPGAVRMLSLKGGGTIKEELVAFSEQTHSFKYRILDSPLPVSSYSATFTLLPGKGGTTRIRWSADFKRKDSSDSPPADQTDEAAKKVITGIFSSGLANLKKQLEG